MFLDSKNQRHERLAAEVGSKSRKRLTLFYGMAPPFLLCKPVLQSFNPSLNCSVLSSTTFYASKKLALNDIIQSIKMASNLTSNEIDESFFSKRRA